MQLSKRSILWLIIANILLALTLLIMIIIVRGGLFEVRGVLAVKSGQRGVFHITKDIVVNKSLQSVSVDKEIINNNSLPKAEVNVSLSSDTDDNSSNIFTDIEKVVNNSDFNKSDDLLNVGVNNNLSLVIVGLGFDLKLTEKVLQRVPPEVALGFSVMNEQCLNMLSDLPNKIFSHVIVNDSNDNFNISGVSSVFSNKENINRVKENISYYKKLDGIYLDMNKLIDSGSNVLSAVLRVVKENNLSILNLNTNTDLQIIDKFAKSSLKFINSSHFMGHVNNDPMFFLKDIHKELKDDKILVVIANECNMESIFSWIDTMKEQEIVLTDLTKVLLSNANKE